MKTVPHADVLIVHRAARSFAERDERILAASHSVERVAIGGVLDVARACARVPRSRAVLCWFAGPQNIPLLVLARLFGVRTMVIPGGYEVMYLPEYGYGWQGSFVRRTLARWTLRLAGEVGAVSPSIQDLIRTAAPGVQPRLIPNAAEPPSERLVPLSERPFDAATAVAASSEVVMRNKGIDLFLGAARALPDLRFLIVGEVRGRDVPDNVTITGLLPPAEAEQALGTARLYIQATTGYEAFGSALLEAMVRGSRPVVTEVGGLPWVVGRSGVVIDRPRVEGVVEGIRRALCSPFAEAAEARVASRFSIERRRRAIEDALGLRG